MGITGLVLLIVYGSQNGGIMLMAFLFLCFGLIFALVFLLAWGSGNHGDPDYCDDDWDYSCCVCSANDCKICCNRLMSFNKCKYCKCFSAEIKAQNTTPTPPTRESSSNTVDVRVEMKDETMISTTPNTTANLDVDWACSQSELK